MTHFDPLTAQMYAVPSGPRKSRTRENPSEFRAKTKPGE